MPALGTCAGMIMLADRIEGGIDGQQTLGGLDVVVRRNAFGRQVDSFETDVDFARVRPTRSTRCSSARPGSRRSAPASRCSPRVADGPAAGRIVAVRQGASWPRRSTPRSPRDDRVHRYFVDLVRTSS